MCSFDPARACTVGLDRIESIGPQGGVVMPGGRRRRRLDRPLVGRSVGRTGLVVATDIDLQFLAEMPPNVVIRRHDLGFGRLDESAYLIHVRAVLYKLVRSNPLPTLVSALKAGGVLLVEEADLGSCMPVDSAYPEAGEWSDSIHRAFVSMTNMGFMDAFLGRRLRHLVEALGLESVKSEGSVHVHRGGEPAARFMELSAQLFGDLRGLDPVNVARVSRLMTDPAFEFVGPTLFAAWGNRPGPSCRSVREWLTGGELFATTAMN
jgi:hypothetical protein